MDARVIEPRMKLAVLAYMDARVDAASLLGLRPGDAHVIRNAGGRATHDAMNAMALSQSMLGTREIMVMHHTECALQRFTETQLAERISTATTIRSRSCSGASRSHRGYSRRCPAFDRVQEPRPSGQGSGLPLRPGDEHPGRGQGDAGSSVETGGLGSGDGPQLARRPEPHGQREIEVGSARGRALEPDAPPCISTIWRAIGKPRPVPPLLL